MSHRLGFSRMRQIDYHLASRAFGLIAPWMGVAIREQFLKKFSSVGSLQNPLLGEFLPQEVCRDLACRR